MEDETEEKGQHRRKAAKEGRNSMKELGRATNMDSSPLGLVQTSETQVIKSMARKQNSVYLLLKVS